ncbi:MAG: peptidoglycan DD-metalloendopeptidase family protein [Gammaproteobacteria bacterium]
MKKIIFLIHAIFFSACSSTLIDYSTSTYIVRQGDTLTAIAWFYNTTTAELIRCNDFRNPNDIYVGQSIEIRCNVRTSDIVLEDEEIIDTPAPVEVAVSLPSQTTPVQSNAWIKPVNGSIVRAYNQGTILSNGIEITSPDSRVVAVQSGRVVYIGRDIIGYRNLILIEHLDNTISAYGFLNYINTSLGMSVNQGEEIGSAGLLSNRQRGIYFEIRRNGGSINPRQIISEL